MDILRIYETKGDATIYNHIKWSDVSEIITQYMDGCCEYMFILKGGNSIRVLRPMIEIDRECVGLDELLRAFSSGKGFVTVCGG